LFGSSYPDGGLSPLTLGYEKILFHSEHLLELLDQEDRVMKRDTSRVMKHNPILQGDMSVEKFNLSQLKNSSQLKILI
jgi:hypothetical protein